MKRIDRTVLKETAYVGAWTVVLSVLLQSVFLAIGRWDYTVLLGNVWGGTLNVLNFFLMGLSVQKALEQDEKQAKRTVRLSQSLRFLMLLVLALIGVILPYFSTWTVVIPLLFTRVAIAIRPLLDKRAKTREGEGKHE